MRIDIFILLLIAAIVLYRWYQKNAFEEKGDGSVSTEMVQDPNCLIYIPETEAIKVTIDDKDHCFCSEKCAEEYRNKKSAV